MNPTVQQQVINALETAKNGLIWYQDRYPEAVDGSDDEAMAEIDAALQEAACTPVPEQDMPGMSPMNRHCAYSAATTLRALGYDWLEHAGQWLPVTPEAPRPSQAPAEVPIDMVLHCPKCGLQHIDAPDPAPRYTSWKQFDHWTNPPHRSHLCKTCGWVWRPADVPTNGVLAVKTVGKNDSSI